MLAVERDVKPRNMNFAKVEKRGGGLIGRGRLLQKIRYFIKSKIGLRGV